MQEHADLDASVTVALQQVAGMTDEMVEALRAEAATWSELRRLSAPIYHETLAIDQAPQPAELAVRAARVDLIIGERNRGRAPYGSSSDDVLRRIPTATLHELSGQGHLAQLEAPGHLAALLNRLRIRAT